MAAGVEMAWNGSDRCEKTGGPRVTKWIDGETARLLLLLGNWDGDIDGRHRGREGARLKPLWSAAAGFVRETGRIRYHAHRLGMFGGPPLTFLAPRRLNGDNSPPPLQPPAGVGF